MAKYSDSNDGISADVARKYLTRAAVGIVAIIMAIVAIVFLVRLVGAIEDVILSFSAYDGVTYGVGIAGFVVCGLLLAGCAALAALPVARFALDGESVGAAPIDRSMVFSIALLVLCVVAWICKLIFHNPAGGSVSGVLYTIFSTFGATATSCLAPVIVAVVILYIVRTKSVASTTARY